MSDLNDKFANLQTQMALQHGEIILALNNIAVALGSTPTTPTTTLADVVAILTDIHADTMSMDVKLLRMRDAIAPLDEALPSSEKSSVAWSLYRLMDSVAPDWPRPTGSPLQPQLTTLFRYFENQFGVIPADSNETLLYYLSRLWGNVGIAEDATGSVIGLLRSIQYQNALASGGIAPPTDTTGAYDDPASSFQVVEHDGRNFARWSASDLPTYVGFTTEISDLPVQVEIQPTSGNGWKDAQIYVQSDAAYFSLDPRNSTQLATNRWIDLSINRYPIAVSVDAEYKISAYLRTKVTATSVVIEAEYLNAGGAMLWIIPWRGQIGAQGSTSDRIGTGTSQHPVWLNTTKRYEMRASVGGLSRYGQGWSPFDANNVCFIEANSNSCSCFGGGPFSIILSVA